MRTFELAEFDSWNHFSTQVICQCRSSFFFVGAWFEVTSILSYRYTISHFFENEKLWVSTNRPTSAQNIDHPDLHQQKLTACTEEMGGFPWKKSLLLWWAYYVGQAVRCAPADHRPYFHHQWLILQIWVSTSSMHSHTETPVSTLLDSTTTTFDNSDISTSWCSPSWHHTSMKTVAPTKLSESTLTIFVSSSNFVLVFVFDS